MLQGKQSWVFKSNPIIISSSAVGGPFEGKGPLKNDFDLINNDIWLGQDSFEKAEKILLEQACDNVIQKAGIKKEEINFFISGDLMNQIITSSFAARTLGVPYLGIFGACSSSMESLALAAQLVDSGNAKQVIAGAASHNAAVEKQFRYPTEYGGQKPPTAQWTVTGAGTALVADKGNGPKVTCATIGTVIDMGLTDPFNMGGAMAPAAVNTIEQHFKDLNRDFDYYDLVMTGDLGAVGHKITTDLLLQHGLNIPQNKFYDCGLLIYGNNPQVFAGGSGCGCSATVTYGHLLKRMMQGELKKLLVVATGALLSPMSYQQKESIPCIAHAVALEM
jgi:stage V sporulation protein AD